VTDSGCARPRCGGPRSRPRPRRCRRRHCTLDSSKAYLRRCRCAGGFMVLG
jgi:hypothetical protein